MSLNKQVSPSMAQASSDEHCRFFSTLLLKGEQMHLFILLGGSHYLFSTHIEFAYKQNILKIFKKIFNETQIKVASMLHSLLPSEYGLRKKVP